MYTNPAPKLAREKLISGVEAILSRYQNALLEVVHAYMYTEFAEFGCVALLAMLSIK